jgi:hypothetical protein
VGSFDATDSLRVLRGRDGIVPHSVPPLAIFIGAEAVTGSNDQLTEAVDPPLAYATMRADRKAREKQDQQTH